MSNTWSNVLIFAAGAAVGSLVAWRILKPYYQQIADEEIESVKKAYSKEVKEAVNSNDEEVETEDRPDDIPEDTYEFAKKLYANNLKIKEKEDKKPMSTVRPRVITPEEFGDSDYETVSLTYYADKVVTDEYDEVMDEDEIEYYIGSDSLTHFGEYEPDSVFVRNDEVGRDYEILLDNRRYSDVCSGNTEG